MRRIIALGVLLLPTAVWAEDWRVLTTPEIEAALTSRVLGYGNGSNQNFFADGRTLYEVSHGESWGKWWAESDRYCSTWPPSETPSCFGVEASGLDVRFTGAGGDVTQGRYIDLQ